MDKRDKMNEKNDKIVAGIVILVVLITGLVLVGGFSTTERVVSNGDSVFGTTPAASGFAPITTGTTGMGDVEIALTPRFAGGELIVVVSANTHSVELNQFRLEELATLIIGEERISPRSAVALGGHHVSGEMVFDAEPADVFTIEIEGIPQVETRVYAWGAREVSYTDITPQELKLMMDEEDVFLIDTHIPEQQHVEGTDAVIPFDQIRNNLDKLPKEGQKIVLYCRSGSMSAEASRVLADLGYTNVYNLQGGRNAWVATGYE